MIESEEMKWNEYRKQTQKVEVEEKRRYLAVKIFFIFIQTCPERGRGEESTHSACCQSPWKQWALLIWPIPLSSVNSPRQHGPYHSCKTGEASKPQTPLTASHLEFLNLSIRARAFALRIGSGPDVFSAETGCSNAPTGSPFFCPVDSAHSAKLSPRLWLCSW